MQNKTEKTKEKSVLRSVYGYFLPTAWQMDKGYFILRFLKLIISSIDPFVGIIMLPMIIDEMMNGGRFDVLLRYVIIMVLVQYAIAVAQGITGNIIERYTEKFSKHYTLILSERIMALDFQKTEDKKALDQLELARNGMGWYSGGVNGLIEPLFSIVSRIITLFGVTYLIVSKAPVLMVLTLVILIASGIVNQKLNMIEQKGYAELSKINRIFGYLLWGLSNFRYGKDIRLYDAKEMMLEKWSDYTEQSNARSEGIANAQLPWLMGNVVIGMLQAAGMYFYLGFLAILGRISIASCTQMINSASVFNSCLTGILGDYQMIVKRANYANEFVKFLELKPAFFDGTKDVNEGQHRFVFEDVSFAYPGSDVKVLNHMNLTINEGEHLSVVGLNGAGKTTMIKLLCRLYDPTEGRILLDGVDIREYDYKQYMEVFAPVFQDFKLFAFSVKENLMLKDHISGDEEKLLVDNLSKVGLKEKIYSFKNGLDTTLFKHFDTDGIEPSGGEQQKLAIARALIKDAPVVVLDEPTAALDPIAEYEIYRQFEDLVKGKTAIYISHRLSSCQFCDHIAVFSEGRVFEYGTHEELVNKKNGVYAEMFAAQAKYYVSDNAVSPA